MSLPPLNIITPFDRNPHPRGTRHYHLTEATLLDEAEGCCRTTAVNALRVHSRHMYPLSLTYLQIHQEINRHLIAAQRKENP